MLREPASMPERHESILFPLPEENGDDDRREVEAPGLDKREVVVQPTVQARLDPGPDMLEQRRGKLARRDLAVGGTEQRPPRRDEGLRRGIQELCPFAIEHRPV